MNFNAAILLKEMTNSWQMMDSCQNRNFCVSQNNQREGHERDFKIVVQMVQCTEKASINAV